MANPAAQWNIGPADLSHMHHETVAYAADLANRFGFKYQHNELWRPKTDDSGIHEAGYAFDVPVDRLSPQGRRIVADAHAHGFYVHEKEHGTGPHIHVETNRNPDGSAKGRG